MPRYTTLFAPIEFGHVEKRNPVFFPPHRTQYGHRLANERHTAYYLDLASGGMGLIVHEPIVVHPSSVSRRGKSRGWDEASIVLFRQTTAAAHADSAKVFCQLIHTNAI